MRRLIYNIMILSIVSFLVSCSEDDTVWKDTGGGSIKLQFTDGLLLSRAVDDSDKERAIKHLDVFIFEEDQSKNPGNLEYYERIDNPSVSGDDNEGTVTLRASLSQFDKATYYVYVVANATTSFTGDEKISSWTELSQKIQEDENIHMTGTGLPDMPTHFLMDGIAKVSETDNSVSIDPESNQDITLSVVLKRAAAKVIVTLKLGDKCQLLEDNSNHNRGYYFRNMPYKSTILDFTNNGNQVYPTAYLRTPAKANDQISFDWKPAENGSTEADKVIITGYLYSHEWKDGSWEDPTGNFYSNGTSLIVNIPLLFDEHKDGESEIKLNNYYQIPLVRKTQVDNVDHWKIERNTLYKVSATIEAPGAEDNKEPVTLDKLMYKTENWEVKPISVGNEVQPTYLEVNKNLLEMHNVATDATLEFTSSAPVTVKVSDAYYYNKYGQKISVPIEGNISVPARINALTGKITINSVIPENLTARYFTITVTNTVDTKLQEVIKVIQYPVICVSNQLGWYSYRDDFNFNWLSTNQEGARVSVSVEYKTENNKNKYLGNNYGTQNGCYINIGSWRDPQYVSYFFNSKVIENITDDNKNDAKHTSYFYDGTKDTKECEENNMRMYQMQVMATSPDYVVGKPRIGIDGQTDSSIENNKLVSPAFMIASRLGAVYPTYGNADQLAKGGNGGWRYDENSGEFEIIRLVKNNRGNNYSVTTEQANYDVKEDELLKFYANHCANYVEVVGSGANQKVYEDWRLPTMAEIVFIINNQGTSGSDADAIDYLLNGAYYYSARGPVYNPKRPSDEPDKAIRCVHDLDKPELLINKKE